MAHAAPNSRVGRIAAYRAAIEALNKAPPNSLAARQALTRAALALSQASNKSVTTTSVSTVNTNLGLKVSARNVDTIVALASKDTDSRR